MARVATRLDDCPGCYQMLLRSMPGSRSRQAGFQFTELIVALAIVSIISSVAIPTFSQYLDRARMRTSINDMMEIELHIQRYVTENFAFPDNLGQAMTNVPLDPWGKPFEYLRIDGGTAKGKGKLRKDKNLVPVNSDYDLYSKGKDGKSVAPFTAKHSRDDIVRANNGAYFGRAEDY